MSRLHALAFAGVSMRLLAGALAVVLSGVPFLMVPVRAVAVTGGIGVFLVVVGVAARWRWPITAAACVFVTAYTATLWVTDAPVSVLGAAAFGLALLVLLQSAELGRSMHRAAVSAGVVRSQVVRWIGFSAATLAAAMLVTALASAGAASIPSAAAPFLAAAGALGVILAVTAAVIRVARQPSGAGNAA